MWTIMTKGSKEKVEFVCRDCGAEFLAEDVFIPAAEPRSQEKTAIEDNKCPKCGGILDLQFPTSD